MLNNTPLTPIEDYLWEHHRQRSLWGRKYDSIPKYLSTGEFAKGRSTRQYGESLELKVTWFRKFIILLFLLYGVNCAILLSGGITHTLKHAIARNMLLGSILLLVLAVIYELFLARVFRKVIWLDRDGIRISDRAFRWADIQDTYLMRKPRGRTSDDYLLILGRDGSVAEYKVTGFLVTRRRLSFAVEHYKGLGQLGISRRPGEFNA